ncbi:MAG TPA: helix-turn-helix transcriptional regulator [Bauldia sp.]|nr:helix-turn-helix transcriptional regulator [Bauldia sp.]
MIKRATLTGTAFGPWIRAEREKAGIGLNDFAHEINISPAYWSRIERGHEKAPKDELIIAACKRLGLDTDRAFIEARRLPPDMQIDIATAVTVYRRFKERGRK